MFLILGTATPMAHQSEDVARLEPHPRINIWNGLGTGKTCTAAWWLQRQWMLGRIDEVILVGPSMVLSDWQSTFEGLAWPDGMVDFIDCRPPDHSFISERLSSKRRSDPGQLTVMATTYGGVRALFAAKEGKSRWVEATGPMMDGLRGRKMAAVFDEAQNAALQTSGQGLACRTLSAGASCVVAVTATPIGNPLSMRLWGLTDLVRPDILMRQAPGRYNGKVVGPRGSFTAFKYRYAVLVDPVQVARERGGERAAFVPARAYPTAIHEEMVKNEVLGPLAPVTVRRRKEDCLDLPPKVRLMRTFRLPPAAQRALDGIVDDDRAVLDSGRVVVPSNILEERLRCLELCGGWLEGEPLHNGKLVVLQDVLEEVVEAEGARAPVVIWASRSRELIGAAAVAAGAKPEEALDLASLVYPPDTTESVRSEYVSAVQKFERAGVGVLHGPTQDRDRDRIQKLWKEGSLRTVVAHPGVAGAGLNWQHVKATVYFGQPMGTIARQQSEDRVHRHGLKHVALYFDIVVEDGPDEAIARAHAMQRDAELELLDWLIRKSSYSSPTL